MQAKISPCEQERYTCKKSRKYFKNKKEKLGYTDKIVNLTVEIVTLDKEKNGALILIDHAQSLYAFQHQWNFQSELDGVYIPSALWSEGVTSNPVLLDEVCDSSHLGTEQEDLVPEVVITSNNVAVPESLMQLDDAQLIELIRICPDPLINDGNQRVDLYCAVKSYRRLAASFMMTIHCLKTALHGTIPSQKNTGLPRK